MPDHICKCTSCRPDLFPSGPRQNENHVAIRFGMADLYCKIYLDDQEAHRVFEALGGANGWIVRFTLKPGDSRGNIHVCTCGVSGCAEVVQGYVRIERPRVFRPAQNFRPW